MLGKSKANYSRIFSVLQFAVNVSNTLLTYEYSYIYVLNEWGKIALEYLGTRIWDLKQPPKQLLPHSNGNCFVTYYY